MVLFFKAFNLTFILFFWFVTNDLVNLLGPLSTQFHYRLANQILIATFIEEIKLVLKVV